MELEEVQYAKLEALAHICLNQKDMQMAMEVKLRVTRTIRTLVGAGRSFKMEIKIL